jgi:hypothetical protein
MFKFDHFDVWKSSTKDKYQNLFATEATFTFRTSDAIKAEQDIFNLMRMLTVINDDHIHWDGVLVQDKDHCHAHIIFATDSEMKKKDVRNNSSIYFMEQLFKFGGEENSKRLSTRYFFKQNHHLLFTKYMHYGNFSAKLKYDILRENDNWVDYCGDQFKRHPHSQHQILTGFIERRSGRRMFHQLLVDAGVVAEEKNISFTNSKVFQLLEQLAQSNQAA